MQHVNASGICYKWSDGMKHENVKSENVFQTQVPKFCTLAITIDCYHVFETIAKNNSIHFSENTKMRISF